MLTVSEISRQTGVSVRTLHHYDAIGLLKPACVTETGYRLYDEASLVRLQSILLFRELEFPLAEIRRILDDESFDPDEALSRQISLLEKKKARLEVILDQARAIQKGGVKLMNFEVFDENAMRREAQGRWGGTAAWKAFEQKEDAGFQEAGTVLMKTLSGIASLRERGADDMQVQAQVKVLQDLISTHFYPCTDEILAGLGEMYAGDERFRRNIDHAGGAGAAEFIREAIRCFTSGKGD